KIGDALARLDAERDKRVRNAVGLDVELGEGGLAALEFIGQRVAARPGAVAHHLGEISRLLRSGHVSPVVSCFGYAEFGVIARERQYGIAIAAFHRRPRGGGDPYAAAYW